MKRRTYHEEDIPQAPPPSPTKFTLLTCAEIEEACPSPSCTLRLVDRKIEAHQARLSPIQTEQTSGPYSPALLSVNVSGRKLEGSDEPIHKTTSLRQVSSASGHHDMTTTNSSYHLTRSSGTDSLVLSPKTSSFCLFNQSCRKAIEGVPGRFRFPSQGSDASEPRPTVTGRHIFFPASIGASAMPDIAELPLEYKESKTNCWPDPCSQLLEPETVIMPEAAKMSKSRKCDFDCAYCLERIARCNGEMPSCGECLSGTGLFASDQNSNSLQTLTEHSREEEEEATGEEQTAILEEVHSHFSDDSTDEDDDGKKVTSNVRLFKLNQKSKTRLSWGSLFSKP